MNKKCINCGSILEDGILFCSECGMPYKDFVQEDVEKTENIPTSSQNLTKENKSYTIKTCDEKKTSDLNSKATKPIKKRGIIVAVTIFIAVVLVALAASLFLDSNLDGSYKTQEEIIAENNYRYFDIVEMINNEQYDAARARIDEVYEEITYSENSTDSFNKMNLLRLYYHNQQLFNDTVDEIIVYLKESSLLNKVANGTANQNETVNFNTCISSIENIFSNLNSQKQEEVKQLLGDHLNLS